MPTKNPLVYFGADVAAGDVVRFGESTREYVEPAAAVAHESHAAQVRADEGGIAQRSATQLVGSGPSRLNGN
jgi:hypothetical protein